MFKIVLLVGALSLQQFQSLPCGTCIQIQGPIGSIIVPIEDSCPACNYGDVYLSEAAFSIIAEVNHGIAAIDWFPVTCPSGSPVPPPPPSSGFSGFATYFIPDGITPGSCGYSFDRDNYVVGISLSQINSFQCGACIQVQGPLGTVVVQVEDTCSDCRYGEINLSQVAFDTIANDSVGRVYVNWFPVQC